jgi:hypothetical protein
MSRLVMFFRQRADFRLREFTHAFLQQLLFFRQFKVHLVAPDRPNTYVMCVF